MLSINTNLSSLITQRSMKQSTNKLNQAVERMTTGYKINHASDNAANYSIKTNMDTKIGAYQVAEENAMMGLDMLQTAESSLNQISDKLSRLRALVVTAQNGTYGTQSLSALNSEAGALTQEINRIFQTATYNGKKLLDAYHTEIPDDVGCQVDLTPRYNGFIQDPVDYTDAEVALMNKMSEVDVDNDTISGGQYSISTAEDLAKLATMTNDGRVTGGEFVLAEDIDLAPYLNGASWTPIGNGTNKFTGTFNGNGHVIENLYINNNQQFQGLFGCSGIDVVIKNVGISNANITSHMKSGCLVGCLDGGNIINCWTTGSIKSSQVRIGGLVGDACQNRGSIEYCYSTCIVESTDRLVGGIAGVGDAVDFSYCFFSGTVKGNTEVGGLGGLVRTAQNCYVEGDVSGVSKVGGISGDSYSTHIIINCHSTANISGTEYVGGLVGQSTANITNSYCTGNVSGTKYIGGIAGKMTSLNYSDLYSYGSVTGNEFVGGIAGLIDRTSGTTTIDGCKSYSQVTGVTSTGSLFGGIANTTNGTTFLTLNITNCQSSSDGLDKIGGVYQNSSGVYTSLDTYDMSPWLAGISSIYIPPDETTLQVGIKSADSSSLVFNATVEYGALDVLQGLDIQDASAISTIDTLMKQVSDKQTELGATQNRLMSVLEEINVQYENLVSSRSTIQDADMSEVSATYIQQQILQQASATLMSTANQSAGIALQLI